MDWLAKLLGLDAGNATIDAGQKNAGVVQNYGTQANNLIDTGASGANDYLQQALGLGQNLVQQAGTTYQQSPGYQFTLDQGLQAIDRGNAAHGNLASGQSNLDYANYATGLANKDYGDWFNRLSSASGTETSALDNLANLSTGTANSKVGIAGDVAGGLTSSNNEIASGQEANAASWGNLGKAIMGGLGTLAGRVNFSPTAGFSYGGF